MKVGALAKKEGDPEHGREDIRVLLGTEICWILNLSTGSGFYLQIIVNYK